MKSDILCRLLVFVAFSRGRIGLATMSTRSFSILLPSYVDASIFPVLRPKQHDILKITFMFDGQF